MIPWDALTSYMILGVGAAGSTNIGEKSRDVNYSWPRSQNWSERGPIRLRLGCMAPWAAKTPHFVRLYGPTKWRVFRGCALNLTRVFSVASCKEDI